MCMQVMQNLVYVDMAMEIHGPTTVLLLMMTTSGKHIMLSNTCMQCIWSLIVTAGAFFIDPTSTVVIDSFTTAAELSCNVSQVPDGLVRYKWTIANNGQTLQPSITHEKYHVRTKAIDSETQSLTLKILDLNHSDAGKYICGAVEEEDDDMMTKMMIIWLL